jgi:hypothetical protein
MSRSDVLDGGDVLKKIRVGGLVMDYRVWQVVLVLFPL